MGPEAGNKIFGANIEICAGCLTLSSPRSGTDVFYAPFSALAARARKSTRDEPQLKIAQTCVPNLPLDIIESTPLHPSAEVRLETPSTVLLLSRTNRALRLPLRSRPLNNRGAFESAWEHSETRIGVPSLPLNRYTTRRIDRMDWFTTEMLPGRRATGTDRKSKILQQAFLLRHNFVERTKTGPEMFGGDDSCHRWLPIAKKLIHGHQVARW
jgi:hypothetical protein